MVEDSAGSAYEEIDTISEMACLLLDTDTTVNSEYREFSIVVFYFLNLVSNLECQLTGRSQNDGLDPPRAEAFHLTQVLDSGKPKGKCLTRAGEVSGHDIIPLVNRVEAVLLDWKQVDITFFGQSVDGFVVNFRE